ncbi:MAG: co-chaperone DjlA [Pseudomonadota bacterium]|nr:co-chaperone DjlA [Pseudomonadota bacterium]
MTNRSFIGRLIGLVIGLMLSVRFGFFGLLAGYWLGAQFDRALDKTFSNSESSPHGSRNGWDEQLINHLFSLLGYIAKSGGVVSASSIRTVESIMTQQGFDSQQRKKAIQAFNQGKTHSFHMESTTHQLRLYLMFHPEAKSLILDCVKQVGEADQPIPMPKVVIVNQVFAMFGRRVFNGQNFHWEHWHHQSHQHSNQSSRAHQGQNLSWAYKTLGASKQDSMASITKKYRKLLSQYHPDRLQSKLGTVTDQQVKQANEKTHEIKKAYDLIKSSLSTAG